MNGRWQAVITAAALGALCAFCVAPEALFSLVNDVLLGWLGFLKRVGPSIEWHPFGWFVAVAAFGFTAFGVQRVVSSKRQDWPWSKSLAAVAAAVLACAASIALVGAIHELGWMLTSKRPIVSTSADWGRRSHSESNLKQIGLALDAYERKTGVLPTLGAVDHGGAVGPGWLSQIEPYLETRAPVSKVDAQTQQAPDKFLNPGVRFLNTTPDTDGHYAGNMRLLGRTAPTKSDDITDGTSNTLMAGEIESGFRPWRDPGNLRDPALGIRPGKETFCGPWKYRQGAFFLKADGSVHFFSNRTNPKVLKALATPDSGDEIPEGNWEK